MKAKLTRRIFPSKIMGDEGDIWNEVKKQNQAKRWQNVQSSLRILHECGIAYETLDESTAHYRIDGISFWPSTGKFYNPKTGLKGRGVKNLIIELKKQKSKS